MRTTCVVNNFNYGRFLVDAVASALNQTVPFDEIVIVDDASTDGSDAIIRENFSHYTNIKIVIKDKNEGQLSAFNEGVAYSTGDIICFLDSDDMYEKEYLEQIVSFYKTKPECDFLFCAYTNFDRSDETVYPFEEDRDFGYSIVSTLYRQRWIGGKTSTLSIRKPILDKFLPIPNLSDWKVRADDCLVWGASLAQARKFYLSKLLVRYRIHQSNNYTVKEKQQASNYSYIYAREIRIHCLFSFFCKKLNYQNYPIAPIYLACSEFRTIQNPSSEDFWLYFNIIKQGDLPLIKKGKMLIRLSLHFFLKRN